MAQRLRVGLARLGRMGRIHAANLAWHCPSAELTRDHRRGRIRPRPPVGAEPLGVPVVPDFDVAAGRW